MRGFLEWAEYEGKLVLPVIDLGIRFLSENHRVFVLHPGAKKRFYQDFCVSSAVFLDLPGASLPPCIDLENSQHISEIFMGRQIGLWHRNGKSLLKVPSRDSSDYALRAAKSRTSRYMWEAKGLYSTARPGDLVIVPGSGYMSRVFIGEFIDTFDRQFTVSSGIYPDEKIPARRVKWISIDQIKAYFSYPLIKLMQNRQALIEIKPPEEKNEIYDLCYKEYAFSNQAHGHIKITKLHVDLRAMIEANEFVSYFVSMYNASRRGQLEAFSAMDWKIAAEEFYDSNLLIDTSYSISSPGWLKLLSKYLMLPGFVAAMLSLVSSGLSLEEAKKVQITNSVIVSDEKCVLQIDQSVREVLNMMNADQWERTCQAMREAKEGVGLESTMKVQK